MRWTGTMRPPRPDSDPRRLRSTVWLRFFRLALTRSLKQSFHAVRIARPGFPSVPAGTPLIVYLNHPSWWDGAFLPVLLDRVFPSRCVFGPIDAAALQRYGFMRRLGFFGVEAASYSGAATFLRVGADLLAHDDTLLCLTPEGRFVDPRLRPVRLQRGLARLIAAVPRVTVLPMAVEYPFWTERTPEALARFGEPMTMGSELPASLVDLRSTLEARLVDVMDRLADDAISRDAGRFSLLLDGRAGVGGAYDLGRRIKAWSRGRRFDPAHEPRVSDRSSDRSSDHRPVDGR